MRDFEACVVMGLIMTLLMRWVDKINCCVSCGRTVRSFECEHQRMMGVFSKLARKGALGCLFDRSIWGGWQKKNSAWFEAGLGSWNFGVVMVSVLWTRF